MSIYLCRRWVPKVLLLATVTLVIGTYMTVRALDSLAADDGVNANAPRREHAPHGTKFWFEVVESFNAKYQGDTPGHIGRGGGITLHPHVALGDPVHHHRLGEGDHEIGIVTGVVWDRLKGSITVEFSPKENHRIAVGDQVWVDLNPAMPTRENPHAPVSPATP